MVVAVCRCRRVIQPKVYGAGEIPVLLPESWTVRNGWHHNSCAIIPPGKKVVMNSRIAVTIIVIAAFVALGVTLLAQNRPYDQVMKEVAPTYANLKKSLDSSAFAVAAEDAAKLEGLFKETETFWTPFKTKDALDFAKSVQLAARNVSAAAKEMNGQKAQAAYNAIGKSCKGCHDSHRETMPDKSFKIKP